MFYLQEGFTYRNFLMDVLAIFIFVVWFWLLITVFADLFRRHDISGWIKAIWVIALIVFSYIAVLAYLIFQGRGMAERNAQQAQQARDELRRVVGFSVADALEARGARRARRIHDPGGDPAKPDDLRTRRIPIRGLLEAGIAVRDLVWHSCDRRRAAGLEVLSGHGFLGDCHVHTLQIRAQHPQP